MKFKQIKSKRKSILKKIKKKIDADLDKNQNYWVEAADSDLNPSKWNLNCK